MGIYAKGFNNVAVLTLAQAFAFTAVPMLMFIGSFIGAKLAPDAQYATLPLAVMVVGSALGTVPAALLMQRFGRKVIFILANIFAASACLGVSYSLSENSFFLFCFFIFLIGMAMAAMQQFRFAAMESVEAKKMPTAASSILLGGVVAAFVGPELALLGQHFTDVEYQGSFYLAMLAYLLCAVCLLFFKAAVPPEHDEKSAAPRPLRIILNSRLLWLAIGSAGIGYALMSFIMTATPISMHHLHGHSLSDTKWVIQSQYCLYVFTFAHFALADSNLWFKDPGDVGFIGLYCLHRYRL
ncbi:MAG: MFS transporter [Pseudomonadales bacterium]|nr:MFS transporter [Pseudomonadales bacterium]